MEIQNYEDYLIYDDGLVFSEKRNIFLKPRINRNGYEMVILYKNGKKKFFNIHRLVALHYLPKIEGKDIVDHIDGNKLNNNVNNLRWVTNQENCNNYKSMNSNNKLNHKNICYHKGTKLYQFDKHIYGKKYHKTFKTLTETLCYKYIFNLKKKAGLI